jgi:hypothetical protein
MARGAADERDDVGSHERSWTRMGAGLEVSEEKNKGAERESGEGQQPLL